ncbi:tRNA (adenosine(37)-N6)-threonylcarbamoyltransferase complex ATPase subunit type 1 TsaE [Nereida sp. MMG025]|uniref:tRNA (adenosine(37)-N6)-threonylcarbamoyltransferase complex ATPase subunit type 1 TsaE n=1 Tax=Nereida sp. MMG025 TaxID=2909981 RepID=UPI001F0203EE|nr:tRNA (adenosine(37)-N6)-threonylcarbamoyltransferase complex ATPase subunit type 1 TsaE [Nereida sp. MMG025]MCF6444640.1 tRNA (adenosine(37)-N6)-threonylcarbamoyltransferase complex ATPase subunit type 1 TsaE [Nereida sp. MMG025]
MSSHRITLQSHSPQNTADIAQALGQKLRAGDCLLFEGPVGAGKSLFCRALIQSLQDTPEDVPSPTFTLIQTYDTGSGEVWHCDLYRINDPFEIAELGLLDAFETSICLVEWPDRLGNLAPQTALHVALADAGSQTRDITISGDKRAWAERLAGISHAAQ